MATKTTKEGYVKIRIPVSRENKDDVYVGLNGVGYLIKRGQEVEVPEGVYEILQRQEEMLEEAMAYEDALSKAAYPGELV